jgi:hypothetical protein
MRLTEHPLNYLQVMNTAERIRIDEAAMFARLRHPLSMPNSHDTSRRPERCESQGRSIVTPRFLAIRTCEEPVSSAQVPTTQS